MILISFVIAGGGFKGISTDSNPFKLFLAVFSGKLCIDGMMLFFGKNRL